MQLSSLKVSSLKPYAIHIPAQFGVGCVSEFGVSNLQPPICKKMNLEALGRAGPWFGIYGLRFRDGAACLGCDPHLGVGLMKQLDGPLTLNKRVDGSES